jgi:hypothetical protein
MTDYTPRTIDVRGGYAASRLASNNIGWFYGFIEFDRWLAAHDQGVRDAMTAKEHLEAAWDAAYPVPANGRIPKGTKCLTRYVGQDVVTAEAGCDLRGGPDIRTLEPLPPLIPDGTPAVWASTKDCDGRRVLVLSEEPIGDMLRYWRDGDGDEYRDEQLIDPAPIPKEER